MFLSYVVPTWSQVGLFDKVFIVALIAGLAVWVAYCIIVKKV
jgi:hypothetical protein